MKKSLFIFILGIILSILFIIMLNGVVLAKSIDTLKDYEGSINYTCEQAEDCEIKDVGNCCGYHPECVNKDSIANRTLVAELCVHGAQTGLCGFKDIKSCKCENNKCIGSEEVPKDYCENDNDCEVKFSSCSCSNVCAFKSQNNIDCERACTIEESNMEIQSCKCIDKVCLPPDKNIVGNDRDEHGCIGSAGYNWCEEKQKCLRIWEENCSDKNLPGQGKVKILPETASQIARAKLGELGFNITLKEVGKGNETRMVYEAKTKKEGRLFGFLKVKADVSAEIDAETGEVTKVHKPWWSFMATGI